MKPNYQNWVPKKMVVGFFAGAGAALLLFVLFGLTGLILHGTARVICAIVLGLMTLLLLGLALWMLLLHRSFDYDGKQLKYFTNYFSENFLSNERYISDFKADEFAVVRDTDEAEEVIWYHWNGDKFVKK